MSSSSSWSNHTTTPVADPPAVEPRLPKERPTTVVRDLAISGRPTVLVWRSGDGAAARVSARSPRAIPRSPRARMAVRLKVHLATRAQREGNFAQVAGTEGVSYDTMGRC